MKRPTVPALANLIREMLKALDDLGQSPIARIDARMFAHYFKQKAKRLGVEVKKGKNEKL